MVRIPHKVLYGLYGVVLLLILALAGGGYYAYRLHAQFVAQAADDKQTIQTLNDALEEASTTNAQLSDDLASEKTRNDNFEDQIHEITGTVGTIDKLEHTDPQLLAKYSKVYFLNENYTPASLSDIPATDTLAIAGKSYQFLTDALPFLKSMIADAKSDGVDLQVLSSYRSFGQQAALKAEYTTTYGTGANAFSADQGYSEHQLGTTLDFTTPSLGGGLDGFDATPAYAWLTKNAYKYGFILSYPKGNTYYEYEPWHWRFVGVSLAKYLHSKDENFYDMDQRDINTYLVEFPD